MSPLDLEAVYERIPQDPGRGSSAVRWGVRARLGRAASRWGPAEGAAPDVAGAERVPRLIGAGARSRHAESGESRPAVILSYTRSGSLIEAQPLGEAGRSGLHLDRTA